MSACYPEADFTLHESVQIILAEHFPGAMIQGGLVCGNSQPELPALCYDRNHIAASRHVLAKSMSLEVSPRRVLDRHLHTATI